MPPSPRRIAALAALAPILAGLPISACGESEPPPRKTPSRVAPVVRGEAAPTGTTASSLGDSALEPAAEAAAKAEDWKRAESLYRELSRRQPDNPAGTHGLGVALMRQERHDEAAAALADSLKIKDDGRTRIDIAAAYAGAGRYPTALPHLRRAVVLLPKEPAAWTGLCEALLKVDKLDAAAESLQESRRACPGCPGDEAWGRIAVEVARGHAGRADKLAGSGDLAGARKALDAATALEPELPEAHLAAAKLARAKGDGKGAVAEYRRAIEKLPPAGGDGATAARLELAALLLERGDSAEAVKLAREVVGVQGENQLALLTLGRACDAARDRDCAHKAYSDLLRLPPGPTVSRDAREQAQRRVKELQGKGKGKAKGKGKGKGKR
jgi:tetratricopeptide (TPR) repeat protein